MAKGATRSTGKTQLLLTKVNARFAEFQHEHGQLEIYTTECRRLEGLLKDLRARVLAQHKEYVRHMKPARRGTVSMKTMEAWVTIIGICKEWIHLWETRIASLHARIENVQSRTEETLYRAKVQPLLDAYKIVQKGGELTADVYQSTMGRTMPSSTHYRLTIDDILSRYDEMFENVPVVVEETDAKNCAHCGVPYVDYVRECLLVCHHCSRSKEYILSDERAFNHGDMNDIHNPTYQRISHYRDKINKFQARQQREIPPNVLQCIIGEFRTDRLMKQSEITPKRVRDYLRRNKLQKWYDDDILISCIISGNRPPSFTPEQESLLYTQFAMIQAPYDNCPTHLRATRNNFLNYNFCLYKQVEMNASIDATWYKFLPYIPILKSPRNHIEQCKIWSWICQQLNWPIL